LPARCLPKANGMLRSQRSWTGSPDTGALIEAGIGAVLLIGYGTLVMILYPLERLTRRRHESHRRSERGRMVASARR
jgi:ABC-type uncharacterized transport system YnjBCD permease subunit